MNDPQVLGEEKISRLLLKFSIPAIIGMLVSSLYNVIDRIFIGHSMGSLGIAGVTIGFPIMMIQMAFGMLIGVGATSLVSLKMSKKNKKEAFRSTASPGAVPCRRRGSPGLPGSRR